MILTDKTLKDFTNWRLEENYDRFSNYNFHKLDDTFKRALILEWFDLVGYTIDRDTTNGQMKILDWNTGTEYQDEYLIDCDDSDIKPFSGWYDLAISKANEIYNSK